MAFGTRPPSKRSISRVESETESGVTRDKRKSKEEEETTRMFFSSVTYHPMKLATFPRAAVSVAVRFCYEDVPLYVMVQRGNEPNKGMWSLPGGKIKLGETTLQAARRELWEETKLGLSETLSPTIAIGSNSNLVVKWYPSPFTSTDFVQHVYDNNRENYPSHPSHLKHPEGAPDEVLFHYVISQCFAEINVIKAGGSSGSVTAPPTLIPCDDAMDARWWSLMDVKSGVKHGLVSDGCDSVLERAEFLYNLGCLP